jgi:hypothetical protein
VGRARGWGGRARTSAVSAQEQRFGARRHHAPAVHVEAPFLGQKPALDGRGRGLGFLHHRGFVHIVPKNNDFSKGSPKYVHPNSFTEAFSNRGARRKTRSFWQM